ncbi:MAG: hypothetical protein NT016_03910 [Candidatus Aenigmarchaeota archaeon]|nr:hypothetical protein [Candidatus Aenigmarchaeota archaeon]
MTVDGAYARKVVLILAAAAISTMLLSGAARALSVTATLEQPAAGLNAGTQNQLVKFAVTPDAPVFQVKITPPSGITYYGSGYDTNTSGTWNASLLAATVYWQNSTTDPILAAGVPGSFSFHVSTSATVASYNFDVTIVDASAATSSASVAVNVADLSAPALSASAVSPATPVQYAPSGAYTFSTTATDNVGVSIIKFRWNDATNYTTATTPAVTSSGSTYSIALTGSDVAPGNYTWKWYASDATGNESSTSLGTYNVTKADNPMVMYFNGNAATSYSINQGNTVNVTGSGQAVSLYKNGTLMSNPYVDLLPIGDYYFKANSSGSANYSANVVGVTYILRVMTPPPSYSISTSFPSIWRLNVFALFNITWTDLNDANGFSVALIQHNASGTDTNYTMTRITGTNTATYGLNMTQPMTLMWRVYANNSANSWNATPTYSALIGKLTPTLTLSAVPGWSVLKGVQTSVACLVDTSSVTVVLYRNGVSVSNPDIQTLVTGYYPYLCNSTATGNYSAYSVTTMMYVLGYAADVSFVKAPAIMIAPKGVSNATIVVVKNAGNASQPISLSIENITAGWYSINATSTTVTPGGTTAFLVNFTVPVTAEPKDYAGVYRAAAANRNTTSGFVLRVTPSESDTAAIDATVSDYRASIDTLLRGVAELKEDTGITNQTESEQKALDAQDKLAQVDDYVAAGDYHNAQLLLDQVKQLIADAQTALDAERQVPAAQAEQANENNLIVWGVGAGVAIVVLVLAFLLWPGKGFSPRTGSFTFKSPTEQGKQKVDDVMTKIEDLGRKFPGMKKSFAPQRIQPQQALQQPSYQPQVVRPEPAGYSFQPKPMIPAAGRFANEQPLPKIVKRPMMDTVSQKIEELKEFFKQKKRANEVDLSGRAQ